MYGYPLTIEGSDFPNGVGNPVSVTVRSAGPELIPLIEGDVIKYAGGGKNDASQWRWKHVAKLLWFSLDDDTFEHPPALLDALLAVLTKRFRRITAVDGLPAWVQARYDTLLASGAINVMVTGIDFRYPYDDTVEITLTMENRARGL